MNANEREFLKQFQDKDGWIRVEDALPPKRNPDQCFSDQVIVYNGRVTVGTYHYDSEVYPTVPDDWNLIGVTHWQPMPQEPKL